MYERLAGCRWGLQGGLCAGALRHHHDNAEAAVWTADEDTLLLDGTSADELRALIGRKGCAAVRARLAYLA
jgi:hypothetical protein